MTCIVGLEKDGKVYMGGDSAAARGWNVNSMMLDKVFVRGEFLIGYTTSFRMGQLLQYGLEVAPQTSEQDDLEYLATTFIDGIRTCFKDGGYAKITDNQEEGGQFLVGYNGHLYEVDGDFQVNRNRNGFSTVGCGEQFALGSLWETKNRKPKTRIKRALKAATHFSGAVLPPYKIMVI